MWGEARSFVARTEKKYDLIQMPLLTSFGAAAAGTQSLHESYAYTVEATEEYLDHLRPGGLLAITLWLKLPPRDMPKLMAIAVDALREAGVQDPGARPCLDPELEDVDPPRPERRVRARGDCRATGVRGGPFL
jgi:hypothetical protein